MNDHSLTCPKCGKKNFLARYEALYVYSYIIDNDAPGTMNKDEFLSFLFDNRELKDSKQYLECAECGKKYPCTFNEGDKGINMTILQKAIRSDHAEEPGFLG